MSLHVRELPLRHPFQITYERRLVQPSLIVGLADGQHQAWGEATATSYYGITTDSMIASLEKVRDLVEADDLQDLQRFSAHLRELTSDTFALCALEQAAYDLHCRRRGIPTRRLWSQDDSRLPLSNYTIGIDTVERMVSKMQETPWPVYKIKLGTSDDLRIVRELRAHTDSIFRVDANGGWDVSQTLENARELASLGVEFIEQPLPRGQEELMEQVFPHVVLPVIADESCMVEQDVERCRGRFHGVNIKLPKCGGFTPALRMAAQARAFGMRLMAGCMTESSIGISAIAQLAPLLDYIDLDGAMLLREDPAVGVTLEDGHIRYPEGNGNGATLLH